MDTPRRAAASIAETYDNEIGFVDVRQRGDLLNLPRPKQRRGNELSNRRNQCGCDIQADRLGKSDENSSCWVRVAQVWAGGRWGSMHIPRIGQEVIVEFLEGDPDRPIITGRVYNGDNKPPYDLPANQTQSGTKSRSSKGGSPNNFNELRFEDKKGDEHVYLQAEKDLQIYVKHD